LAFYEMGNRQSITQDYVEECKKIFYESYETMVIGPNVFLPHAAPDKGVIEADVQILILKKAIHAPNGSEVDIIVALAPCRNNEHVPWLLNLNDTFLNDEQKNRILESNDMEEVLDIFRRG
jgi:mannitol/fructose-specific phosphotransferase system IIA component (Ntr-type)